jgi:hypothetical protein
MSSYSNLQPAPAAARAVNPGSSTAHSPANSDPAAPFRRENLTASQHPALFELSRAQLGEAGRLAETLGVPVRPVR